jgi:hypothetical protein
MVRALAGESVYTIAGKVKRRKTADERKAEAEAKAAERANVNPDEPWSLQARL